MASDGPYATEAEARDAPMPQEVAQLHRQGRVRSGDPDGMERDTVLRHLLAACEESRVELGAYDRRVLAWLCRWEPTTVQVVIGLVQRAHEAGREARG